MVLYRSHYLRSAVLPNLVRVVWVKKADVILRKSLGGIVFCKTKFITALGHPADLFLSFGLFQKADQPRQDAGIDRPRGLIGRAETRDQRFRSRAEQGEVLTSYFTSRT